MVEALVWIVSLTGVTRSKALSVHEEVSQALASGPAGTSIHTDVLVERNVSTAFS